jgi:alcohol dehydrogenase
MNSFRFHVPTRIIFERGGVHSLGGLLAKENVYSAVVITDRGVLRAGCLKGVFASLDEHRILHETYDGVEQNPTERNVLEALEIISSCSYDSIIAVGGGSSLDTGKAVLALMKEGKPIRELYAGVLTGSAPMPLVAVPTTAGTGSEVTWSAVITNEEDHVKETIRGEYMYPKFALVDPELTLTLPRHITASTGMDALTHALEAYICNRAHALSDALAMEASMLIFGHLRNAVRDGSDMSARSAMSIASTLAGMAFSISGLGMVHGMAEPLGGKLNVPHGIANSVLLPYCLGFNRDAVQGKLSVLARLLYLDGHRSEGGSSQALVDSVRIMAREGGIPAHIDDAKVSEEQMRALVQDAQVNSCMPANPKKITRKDIEAIYREILRME